MNKNKHKLNHPPTGEGKKQSPVHGRDRELDKRSEVVQAQHGRPDLNIGTDEDVEPGERSGRGSNPDRPKAGR